MGPSISQIRSTCRLRLLTSGRSRELCADRRRRVDWELRWSGFCRWLVRGALETTRGGCTAFFMTMVPQAQGELADNLREVGRYSRISGAQDHGLVVLSMGVPYWLMPLSEGGFCLYVEQQHAGSVREQLGKSDRENRYWPPREDLFPKGKESIASIGLYFLLVGGVFLVSSDELVRRGMASEELILSGEWWRVITALTLHADWSHLVGNMAGGFLFFALVFRFFGVGFGWMAILLSGALGNLANAWTYAGSGHNSIGASTAVFGALGVLVGCRVVQQFRLTRWKWPRHLWVPLAAGVVLLGFLGAGGERTDVLAHGWGFVIGGALGAVGSAFRLDDQREKRVLQRAVGWLALLAIMGAWLLALK